MGRRMMMDFELPHLTACLIPESFECMHGDVTLPASFFFGVVKARVPIRQIFQVIAVGEVLVRRLKKLATAVLGADRR